MSIGLVAVLLAVVCAVVLLAVIVGRSFYIAWLVTRAREHTYWDEYTFLPSDLGMPLRRCFSIRGRHHTCRLAHGSPAGSGNHHPGQRLSGPQDVRLAHRRPICGSKGFSIFLLDFRNQGDSDVDTAHTMGQREVKDMLAAVDEVVRRQSWDTDWCDGLLHGRSGQHSRRCGRPPHRRNRLRQRLCDPIQYHYP